MNNLACYCICRDKNKIEKKKKQIEKNRHSGFVYTDRTAKGCTGCPRGELENGQKCEEVCGLQRITNIRAPRMSHMAGNSLILAAKPRTGSEHNRAFL